MTSDTKSGDVIHALKNHLAVILGFSELLLHEFPEDDPRRADLVEVLHAAREAMAMMPEVARRAQEGSR
jgi:signal transduction histidine kinase